MSYVVLARKYRPRQFADMVGQSHVVQALGNALSSGRLHHAYLFTGTRGVGKTTVSRILAKSLNCVGADGQGGVTATPCGACQPCRDIDAGRFVDYTELDAASNRGVDEVQALLEQAVYKPVQGRFKVFMIDEVHMLTTHAFNAMLKTLEEPPDYLKFVLATTDPQKVPVTVLSRCLQFNLRPMAPEVVAEHLVHVLQAEGVLADAGALRLLSRAARGSMRDALSLADQAIAFGAGELHAEAVRRMLGAVDEGPVVALIEALAAGDGRAVLATVDALRQEGWSAAAALEAMAERLQRMAVCQAVPEALDDADPQAAQTAALARALPPDQTQLLYSLCLHGRQELTLAPDEYAGLTMVLLRLLTFRPDGGPHTPAGQQEKKTPEPTALTYPTRAPAPSASAQTMAPAQAAPASVSSASVASPVAAVAAPEPSAAAPEPAAAATARGDDAADDFWFELVQRLCAAEAVTALTRELALQAQLRRREGDRWLLRVEQVSLNQTALRDRLQSALEAHGHAVQLDLECGAVDDSPARRLAAADAQRMAEAEETVLADPFVQTMMRDFGGKIVPGSLKPV